MQKKILQEKILQKKINWIFALILVLVFCSMVYYGTRKEGYHVDELYSYGLANSEYLPFMHFGESGYDVKDWMLEYGAGESLGDLFRNLRKDFGILKECDFKFRESVIYQDYLIAQENSADTRTTSWMSGQEYKDYLCVSESNTFNYASVYYNQRGDVHPPLFYILLHTVCSVFQGTFSKWYGLAINITALLLTLAVLYRMVEKYLGGKMTALSAAAVYGLSAGLVSSAMLIRMYALLTLMTVSFCYIHLRIAAEDFRIKGSTRRWLVLVTLLGFLTHYYFVLYAIGAATVFTVWMLSGKRWKEILNYILTLAGTAAVGLCIWPFAIRHVFSGYRGQESLNIITSGEFYLIRVKLILDKVFAQVLGGQGWILLAAAALVVLICIRRKKQKPEIGKGFFLVLPVVMYIVVVAQIVPFLVERYVMCTYPFWCLFAVVPASLAIRSFLKNPRWQIAAMTVVSVLLLLLNNCYRNEPGSLFTGGQELTRIPENTDCVYVLPDEDWNESAEESLMLSRCREVAVAYRSDLEMLRGTYEYRKGDYVMVVVQNGLDVDSVLEEVREILNVKELPETGREYGFSNTRIMLRQE